MHWLTSSQRAGTPVLPIPLDVVDLLDIANAIRATCDVEGFAQAIRPKRLRQSDWRNDLYPVQIASWSLRQGYQPKFVKPRAHQRTPDLRLEGGDSSLDIECKHKSVYMRKAHSSEAWSMLTSELAKLRDSAPDDGVEFVFGCVGRLEMSYVSQLAETAASALHEMGTARVAGTAGIVVCRKPEPSLPLPRGAGAGLYLPRAPAAWALSSHVVQADGSTAPAGPLLRARLLEIDAHSATQLRESIQSARGQLNPATPGAIYVRLDDSQLQERDIEIYGHVLRNLLGQELSSGENAAIGAIVVTGSVVGIAVNSEDGEFNALRRVQSVLEDERLPSATRLPVPFSPARPD